MDGTKRKDKKKRSRWILLYPTLFFARRIALVGSVLLLQGFPLMQIVIQFAFSITMVSYLMLEMPLETSFANKMEVFNECTIVVLHYGLITFTDFVPDPAVRYLIGWCYIAVFLGNLLTHLTLLIYA